MTNKNNTKRKPFRTYLAYRLMHAALWFDSDWVEHAAMTLTRHRVERFLRERQEGIWDYEESEPEHITVTYH